MKAATHPQLAVRFEAHLQQTKGHVSKVKCRLGEQTGEFKAEICRVVDAFVAQTQTQARTQAQQTIKDVTQSEVRDVALILAAQQVKHDRIAVYGGLRWWATILGRLQDAAILKSIEVEKDEADKLHSEMAESVNAKAAVQIPLASAVQLSAPSAFVVVAQRSGGICLPNRQTPESTESPVLPSAIPHR